MGDFLRVDGWQRG